MSLLLERVEQSIERHGLLRRGQSVLVAVSGGLDSTVLLELLHAGSARQRYALVVAHLNHQLRGRSSQADQRAVVRQADRLGWPIIVEQVQVKEFARQNKMSLEMAARKVRHEFLARTAKRLKIRTIALAHHADDQVELFFLRLFRGSGHEGLAGMRWRNPSPADSQVELIRPLLDQPKAALAQFAVQHKLRFREDASNAQHDILRNRIRHQLLPLLRRDYQPALDRTVARVMDIAGSEAEFVGQCAQDWARKIPLAAPKSREAEVSTQDQPPRRDPQRAAVGSRPFEDWPLAIQRRALHLQLLRLQVTPDFGLIEALRTRPLHPVKVSPQLAVVREPGGRVRLETAPVAVLPQPAVCEVPLTGGVSPLVFDGVRFSWQVVPRSKLPALPLPVGQECFDADKVGPRIWLRHWQPGDRFQPIGMPGSAKLQDLFVNGKIPRSERHALVVAQAAGGQLFWVERLRIADRFKITRTATHGLLWRWKRL